MVEPVDYVWVCGFAPIAIEIGTWIEGEDLAVKLAAAVDEMIGHSAPPPSRLYVLVDPTPDHVRRLLAAIPVARIIVMADVNVPLAVTLMQSGARVIVDSREQLVAQLREQLIETRPEFVRPRWTTSERGIFARIVNRSSSMNGVIERVRSLTKAPDTTALVLGETGTGKELVASAIHQLSSRRDKPFIAVDCGALPESMFEAELFGHEKGAFSGAFEDRKGRFELADGGTIFLDEIGEIPLAMQAKLLRVLEERLVWRIGARAPRPIDVRVIAATNRDLRLTVDQGRFRADLFFRLNVFSISLPALRERGADVLHLADHFFEQFRRELGRDLSGLAPAAKAKLVAYPFPGNVRELRNVIEAAVIATRGPYVEAADLTLPSVRPQLTGDAEPDEDGVALRLTFGESALDNLERAAVLAALQRADGNQTRAAQFLGIQRLALARTATRLQVAVGKSKLRP